MKPSAVPVTEPKPFLLRTEERGAEKRLVFGQVLAEEEELDKENRYFHAIPLPISAPFKPRTSSRPLTEPDRFHLASDLRSKERASFEGKKRAQEMAKTEADRQARLAQEQEESKRIRILRKRLVHTAQPIPPSFYNPMKAAPSNRPLTEPSSPCLGIRKQQDW